MPTPTALRVFTAAAMTVAAAAACSPSEPTATTPGTTPSVFTGSPAPNAPETASTTTSAQPAPGQTVKADLKAPDGTTVATAEFDFTGTYGTLTVKTTSAGVLAPGFHGLHVHSVGKCEASSVAPTGGAPGDFNSAGGHYQRPGHTAHPASGDLTSLEVRGDGSATLVTTTDAFTADDLLAGAGTALIIHEKSDNFANIPPERYQQTNGGTPGPDEMTLSTGDAGKRVACGVLTVG